jgi:hypothetical protein
MGKFNSLERTQSVRKTKGGFPNDNSLLKLLFMGIPVIALSLRKCFKKVDYAS